MSTHPVVEARELSYRVGKSELVKRVSLALEARQLTVLVGPNGAGKSTLLRLLSGELPATNGEISFDGKPLAAWDRVELARRRAMLAQASELSFAFVVEDVVRLGRSPHGDRDAAITREIIEAAMGAGDCKHLRDRLYVTLSGGEQQRVHAARVFAQVWENNGTRALFLDEPTASLDLVHQHQLLACAQSFAKRGAAVACVLHDLNLAAHYADRVIVLNHGTLVADGTARDVFTAQLLAEVFGVDAVVAPHPLLGCPSISVLGPRSHRESAAEGAAHE